MAEKKYGMLNTIEYYLCDKFTYYCFNVVGCLTCIAGLPIMSMGVIRNDDELFFKGVSISFPGTMYAIGKLHGRTFETKKPEESPSQQSLLEKKVIE